MKTLEQLRTGLRDALGAVKDFGNKDFLDDEGNARDMTDEESTEFDALTAKAESLISQVKQRERADRVLADNAGMAAGDGTDTSATGSGGTIPAQARSEPDKFKDFGEFLQSVVDAGMNKGGAHDQRLVWQKASGANEAIPSEGGFLVQTDHSTALLDKMHEMGEIFSRTRAIPISSNSNGIGLPIVDESSRATGSRFGGVRAYWVNEGQAGTASQPAFGKLELRLNKLMAVGYATEELLADAAALEAIMSQAFVEEVTWETEDAFVNGTGSGQPLGFLNSGSLVSVAAEGGQAADTIVAGNVLNMYDTIPTRSRQNAVWLTADSLVEPQMWQMVLPGSSVNIYLPPGQNTVTPGNTTFGSLLGRPVIPVEYLPTLGDSGDICLCDLSQYLRIDKGGVAQNQSMHVRFLWDEMTFRITYRVDGQPGWKQAVTNANGVGSKSPFVTLDART